MQNRNKNAVMLLTVVFNLEDTETVTLKEGETVCVDEDSLVNVGEFYVKVEPDNYRRIN